MPSACSGWNGRRCATGSRNGRERYVALARGLLAADLVEEEQPGTIVMKNVEYGQDAIHGRSGRTGARLCAAGSRTARLRRFAISLDFDVPYHFRGSDLLMTDCLPEVTLAGAVRKLHREYVPLVYAHIPLVCDENGEPLHKSGGVPEAYGFTAGRGSSPLRKRGRRRLNGSFWPTARTAFPSTKSCASHRST